MVARVQKNNYGLVMYFEIVTKDKNYIHTYINIYRYIFKCNSCENMAKF